jgi:class 3 adenylate cyclase
MDNVFASIASGAMTAYITEKITLYNHATETILGRSANEVIGIHFGKAVLRLVGTKGKIEYTAIGDSVNTAKRIQENTTNGQILISAEAYKQVADQVDACPVEPIVAKGKRQPINVYQVLGLRAI